MGGPAAGSALTDAHLLRLELAVGLLAALALLGGPQQLRVVRLLSGRAAGEGGGSGEGSGKDTEGRHLGF